MCRPPAEDGIGEDVVKDLEAVATRMTVLTERSKDALPCERAQHRLEVRFAERRVRSQIGDAVCDLRSGRRNEVRENTCRCISLGGRQRLKGTVEVVFHDLLRTAQIAERSHPQNGGPP